MIALPGGRQAAERALSASDTSVAAVWRTLRRRTLAIAAWLGPLGAFGYLVLAFHTSDPIFIPLVAGGLTIGAIGVHRLRAGRDDVALVLLVAAGMVALAATTTTPAVRGVLWTAMTVIIVAGCLLVRRVRVPRFLAVVTILATTPAVWPLVDLATWSEAGAFLAIGHVTMFFGALSMILARRALLRSERDRLDIYRRVPVGLFRADTAGRIVEANPALIEMLGYESANDLADLTSDELYADPTDHTELYEWLRSNAGPRRFAHRMLRIDSIPIWVRGFVQAVRDGDGTITSFEGAIEDITQRRQAEESSLRNEQRFRNVFERAPIALWEEDWRPVAERLEMLRSAGVVDLRRHLESNTAELRELIRRVRFLDVNPAGIALLGAADKEQALAGVAPEDLPSEAAKAYLEQFVAIWEGKDHLELEIAGRRVDGAPLDCSLHWAASRGEAGLDLSRVVVALTDIGPIKEAERNLEGLVQSKDELVASVSHELRTPITTIMGMALELRDHSDEFSPTESAELIELIADQSRELSNIVEDLLVAARIESDSLAVRPEVLDVAEEISVVLASTSMTHRPELVLAPTRALAWSDPLRLRQIVRNLLSNAIRYGGNRVSIEIVTRAGHVAIRVIDDGGGIPPEERDAVFEAYHRSQDVSMPGSIGLGLAVSRRLARLMGGDLTYRYEDGSVFELTLPVPGGRPLRAA
jgi:PAS domain S-box-containing protein